MLNRTEEQSVSHISYRLSSETFLGTTKPPSPIQDGWRKIIIPSAAGAGDYRFELNLDLRGAASFCGISGI